MITLTREEAQQVLDALKWFEQRFACTHLELIDTIRARLSAPEPEPVIAEFKFQEYGPSNWGDSQVTNPEFVAEQKATNEALRNMVQQEPVAWAYRDSSSGNLFGFTSEYYDDEPAKNLVPLYTAPLQRDVASAKAAEWQGLTDEDLDDAYEAAHKSQSGAVVWSVTKYTEAIEAKLKEKNYDKH
jgi:hypothetical protein